MYTSFFRENAWTEVWFKQVKCDTSKKPFNMKEYHLAYDFIAEENYIQ